MTNYFLVVLSIFLIGCTTISSDLVKTWDEQKILAKISSPYQVKPEELMEQDRVILRQELVSRHSDWSEEIKSRIVKGEIFIGMTKEQALASLGMPHDINRTIVATGVHEQWIYEYLRTTRYVYFENEKLTAMQD